MCGILVLTYHETSRHKKGPLVAAIKISSKVDKEAWNQLKELAEEGHQHISGLLTEAIRDYVRRRRVRPDVLRHLSESIDDNEDLGRLLAE